MRNRVQEIFKVRKLTVKRLSSGSDMLKLRELALKLKSKIIELGEWISHKLPWVLTLIVTQESNALSHFLILSAR